MLWTFKMRGHTMVSYKFLRGKGFYRNVDKPLTNATYLVAVLILSAANRLISYIVYGKLKDTNCALYLLYTLYRLAFR